jgi:hypothetical protein
VVRRADVLDGVAVLVDHSLLREEDPPGAGPAAGEPRLVLLETVREYALERLEATGEAEAVRRRHAAHFLALAERGWAELRGPRQAEWVARVERDHDNVRAALGWALGAGEAALAVRLAARQLAFWHLRGHLAEGRRWLEAALAHGAGAPAALRAQAAFGAGFLAWLGGDLRAGRARIEEAVAWLRELQPPRGRGEPADRWWLGFALSHLGDLVLAQDGPAPARAPVEEAVALLRALGEPWGLAMALTHLGDVVGEAGDGERARRLYGESASLFRRAGDAWMVALPLTWAAQGAVAQGDYAAARSGYEAALAAARAAGHLGFTSLALWGAGNLALLEADHERAAARFAEALALVQGYGRRQGVALSLVGLAAVAGARGQPDRAARLLGAAAALREAAGVTLDAADRAVHDRAAGAAQSALGEGAFAAAWAAGQTMTPEQAIAYALEEAPATA